MPKPHLIGIGARHLERLVIALAGLISSPSEPGPWPYILGQNGQWKRVGRYGVTEDGQTMRIIYDAGGRKLWSRRR